MVAARSAAMGFNRLVDARFDARNPRTAMRELPRGRDDARAKPRVFVVVVVAWRSSSAPRRSAGCAWRCRRSRWRSCSGIRSPSAYTPYTQAFLGLAMAVAPVGGWIAAGGRGGAEPWLLGLAIGSLGRRASTSSMRARTSTSIGARACSRSRCASASPRALLISRALHVVDDRWRWRPSACARRSARSTSPASSSWPALLAWEQSLVRADDLSQVKRAFDLNGWVGVLYFATTAVAVYWR